MFSGRSKDHDGDAGLWGESKGLTGQESRPNRLSPLQLRWSSDRRIVTSLAILLTITPGGLWLLRETASAPAADPVAVRSIDQAHGMPTVDTAPAGAATDLASQHSADEAHSKASATRPLPLELESPPPQKASSSAWDLTEQLKNAWMIVDVPRTGDHPAGDVADSRHPAAQAEVGGEVGGEVVDLSSAPSLGPLRVETVQTADAPSNAVSKPVTAHWEISSPTSSGASKPSAVIPAIDVVPPMSGIDLISDTEFFHDAPEPGCENPQPAQPFHPAMPSRWPATAGSRPVFGVHCAGEGPCRDLRWKDAGLIPWEVFAQGEYVGPGRTPHVPEYRLRVDDQIEFVYRLTAEKSAEAYRINAGDRLRIETLTDPRLHRDALVQPDGTISDVYLGQIPAAGRSIAELRSDLEARYRDHGLDPAIAVTPLSLNTALEELRATVDRRHGNGGQSRLARVTPEGTVALPAIGSVPAHGLTLAELGAEIHFRYSEIVSGLEVTPILVQRAPRYVYVLGEVRTSGRYTLEGPTTLMQALALAGGWNVGAHLKEVVVFRRDECWRLMATKVSLHRPLYGKDPCPNGEIWLRDCDIVVVPKSPVLVLDDFIDMVFTRGIYGVIPFNTSLFYIRHLSSAVSAVPAP